MSDPLGVLLVGATGLIGRAVMAEAVGREDLRLTALARREVPLPAGARMEMRLADPSQWPALIAEIRPQAVICALGTTWRQAGRDEAAFRSVDHDLVLGVARAAKAAGAAGFVTVSSVGANALGRNFYLKVKGETERDLNALRFRRLDILRPGLLRGARGGDRRVGERLAILASPLTDLLLHGEWRKYRSIRAATVARAALGLCHARAAGRFVHEHDAILRAARL